MNINPVLLKRLKTIGHELKPIVTVSYKGITENIHLEVERALEDHELIKIKFDINDREARSNLIVTMLKNSKAFQVSTTGKILLCYRISSKRNKKLSNLTKYQQ